MIGIVHELEGQKPLGLTRLQDPTNGESLTIDAPPFSAIAEALPLPGIIAPPGA